MQVQEFSPGSAIQTRWKATGGASAFVIKQIFGKLIAKALYHVPMLSEHDNIFNWHNSANVFAEIFFVVSVRRGAFLGARL